jgi:probable F420-dependent oxidoreductase
VKIRIGFGPGVAAAGMDAATFWRVVDDCESIGWDSIWFSERATADVLDPLAAMAAAAGRTRRLKFGTSVLVVPGRNPVLLAKELATIDMISGGRLIAGFGLGAPVASEHEAFGVDRSEAPARTEEAVRLIRRLWTEEGVTHEGKFFRVSDLTLRPRPATQPHPAIWFGGHSTAALRRVGTIGDGWLPSFVGPSEYKAKADLVREFAALSGREIEEEHYGALVAYAAPWFRDDVGPVLEAIAKRRPDVALEDVVVVGTHEALRARLEAFVDQGASKFVVIPLGRPRDWSEELARLRHSVAQPLES